jgi:hypothetical protein
LAASAISCATQRLLPPEPPFETVRLRDITPVAGSEGFAILPVRLRFGIESFGVNAYRATGDDAPVIENHDELGHGAGRHEELYFVSAGHAVFELDGEQVEAPAGTFVYVGDPKVRRGAIGREEGTTVLVVGGVSGEPFRASPWEAWLEAAPHLETGDPQAAVEVLTRTLAAHPGNANVLYNLACAEALAGTTDEALSHLSEAVAGDPRAREWARTDEDFDSIRDDARFPRGD